MTKTAEQVKAISKKIVEAKFPDCQVALCAGSIIRGEGTATSDIDLVVVFSQLEKAWRESFLFDGWPVEAFVHDPSTLSYFFQESDAKTGIPSLPQMVLEGAVVWGDPAQADTLKLVAQNLIDAGPAALTQEEIRNRIYGITDLVDDLKAPKSRAEAIGIGVRLYDALGDFILRSNRHWSGNGKQLSRALRRQMPESHLVFVEAFEALFTKNDSELVLRLAEKSVAPFGGFIFDGYRREAPSSWRLPL
jgi:hypothetical protein